MNYSSFPSVTVVIAAYNSATRLPGLVENIRNQLPFSFSKSIEILVVDGGSKDNTKDLASQLGCRVLENPSGHAIAAKFIGYLSSSSQYVCFLDHDELPESRTSFSDKVKAISEHPLARAAISSGYLLEESAPTSNWYASEFGDPYSMYKYRFPNSIPHRANTLKRRMHKVWESESAIGFVANSESHPLLLELVAANSMIDKEYFLSNFPDSLRDENLIPHLYSLLGKENEGSSQIIILKNDALRHESVDSWKTVISKIRWRVANSADVQSTLYSAGVSGRMLFEKEKFGWFTRIRISEWGFLFYTFLLIPVFLDAVSMYVTRKRIGYLMHVPLAFYVIYRGFLTKAKSILGVKSGIKRYDGSND